MKTLSKVELKYLVLEKELIVIVKALEHWYHHLEEAKEVIQVITNQSNLTTFAIKQKLSWKLTR